MRNIDKVADGLDLPLASQVFDAYNKALHMAHTVFSRVGA
jgi:hypothetical protein